MITKTFTNILSLLNVLIYNFYFLFLKLFNKKSVVFLFGNVGSYINHYDLINGIISEVKSKKFYFFKISEKSKFQNFYYFINLKHIKYLFFADVIISNTVPRKLPKRTYNLLIPHDFYDTFPNYKKYREIEKKKNSYLFQYDYVLCANKVVKTFYEKLIKSYKSRKYEKTKCIILGYYKYDYVKKYIKTFKNNKKIILIIGTSQGFFSDKKNTTKFIEKLLKEFPIHKIIFRPHPNENKKLLNYLKSNFTEENRFILDIDPMYIKSFNSSEFAIADYSGSAYSYPILTLKPIIFYFGSKLNKFQKNTNFYKNINSVGFLLEDLKYIKKKYLYIIKNKKKIKNNISTFKRRIFPEKDKFIQNFTNFLIKLD